MTKDSKPALAARRAFLAKLGGAAVGAAAALGAIPNVSAKTEPTAGGGSFPTKDYDWTKHEWGFGVDATKCIGCLRCVEACKRENDVPANAHQFRTWVERYVHLEGDEEVHIDSQQDPVNIAASGSETTYRFANRYKDAKVDKAFFVPKLCNHCTHPSCVQVCPTGATFRTEDGVVLVDPTVASVAATACRPAPTARVSSTRKRAWRTSAPGAITASPRVCGRHAWRCARSAPACSAIRRTRTARSACSYATTGCRYSRPKWAMRRTFFM